MVWKETKKYVERPIRKCLQSSGERWERLGLSWCHWREIFKKYFGKQKLVLGFTLRVRESKDLKFTSRFLAWPNDRYVCLVAQFCLTLCNPMDCNLPGSSVHGVFQARILEWVAIPFSRGFSGPRDRTHVSCFAGGFFTTSATREAQIGNDIIYWEEKIWMNVNRSEQKKLFHFEPLSLRCLWGDHNKSCLEGEKRWCPGQKWTDCPLIGEIDNGEFKVSSVFRFFFSSFHQLECR